MQLLSKMGYRKGKGLGKHGQGRFNPMEVRERTLHEGIGYTKYSNDESDLVVCAHCWKIGHDVDHCWDRHPELKPAWFRDRKGKKTTQADSDSNSESQRKGERIERYRSPLPTFDKVQDRIMEIIQRKIPCTFFGSKQHCVQYVGSRNSTARRSWQ
jgi:hypothetical protein